MITSINEFKQYINEDDYKLSHVLRNDDRSTTLDDMPKDGLIIDKDFYDNMHFYAYEKDPSTKISMDIIKRVKGQPNATVTIFRAVPQGVKEINNGDWVTLSKPYAEHHAMSHEDESLDKDVKIDVSVVREMAGRLCRSCLNLPINSAAMC